MSKFAKPKKVHNENHAIDIINSNKKYDKYLGGKFTKPTKSKYRSISKGR